MKTRKAIKHLKQDKIMNTLITSYDLPPTQTSTNLLESLVESIVSQQLSVKAADTIYKRFLTLFDHSFPSIHELMQIEDKKLRQAGLSYSKIGYIKGIAHKINKHNLDLDSLRNLTDEQVIEELIKFKGVGRWTAEMMLMFDLGRPDIFSLGDLGLRNAVASLYQVNRDDHDKILEISNTWSPYRTLASRYLWKSLDNAPK